MTEKLVEAAAMEILSEEQCVQLLELHDLGRVALQVDDQPEVFPVNYATDGKIVVFRTARGSKLDQATERRIAFEVDDWDPHTGVAWSVMLKGVAEEVKHGSDPFTAALRARPVTPLAPGERDLLLAIYPAEISGRRFRQ
jgi:uncharacterized protein